MWHDLLPAWPIPIPTYETTKIIERSECIDTKIKVIEKESNNIMNI